MRPFSRMMGRSPKQQGVIAEGAQTASRALKMPTFREAVYQFADELARSRRYQHQMTMVAIRPESEQARKVIREPHDAGLADVMEKTFMQLVFFTLGSVLMDSLRSTDKVSYESVSHLYIALLTESGREEAEKVLQRVDSLVFDRIGVHVAAGASDFPRRGFTLEDLVESAKEECLERPMTIVTVGGGSALDSA